MALRDCCGDEIVGKRAELRDPHDALGNDTRQHFKPTHRLQNKSMYQPELLMSEARLIFRVLLPLAAGYYLTYLFRTINALIAADLTAELEVSAAELGFLTSVYFLVFASAQLPLGTWRDRYGPVTIPSALLWFASVGALLFATASSLFGLIAGRALLALGVSMALMAGFKAIVLWYPPNASRWPMAGWSCSAPSAQ